MRILIKNSFVIDPEKKSSVKDILIENGKILSVRPNIDEDADKIINGKGLYSFPGLIDIHVHLREPGHEYKETIESGTLAAAKGGFTHLCCMPNTNPVNDNASVTSFIIEESKKYNHCTLYPVAALTKGLEGDEICEYGELKEKGIVALSDDGRPVEDSMVMRRAVEYAKAFDIPVFCHSEDLKLAGNGVMNEGFISTKLGLGGIPDIAESLGVKRDIDIASITGHRVHIAHVSTKKSIDLIRAAKKAGVKVTAETAPHYFTLTEEAVGEYNTYAKMNPPLRTKADREAVIEGLKDNTLDVIATDHAPHSDEEKMVPFEQAAFGIVGLETSLPLSLELVRKNILSLEDLAMKMSINPGRIIGVDNSIREGNFANITIVNPNFKWEVTKASLVSKSKNSPFLRDIMEGFSEYTINNGNITWSRI